MINNYTMNLLYSLYHYETLNATISNKKPKFLFKCDEFILSSFIKNDEQYKQKKLKKTLNGFRPVNHFIFYLDRSNLDPFNPFLEVHVRKMDTRQKFINMIKDMLDYVEWQIIRF